MDWCKLSFHLVGRYPAIQHTKLNINIIAAANYVCLFIYELERVNVEFLYISSLP